MKSVEQSHLEDIQKLAESKRKSKAKGRLQAEAMLYVNAQKVGYRLTAECLQPWDGNCWFHATLFHLNRLGLNNKNYNAKTLRIDIFNYILNQKAAFIDLFQNYDPKRPCNTPEEREQLFVKDITYLRDTSNYKTESSADSMSAKAIMMFFSLRIKIVNSADGKITTIGHELNKHEMAVGLIDSNGSQHIHALVEISNTKP